MSDPTDDLKDAIIATNETIEDMGNHVKAGFESTWKAIEKLATLHPAAAAQEVAEVAKEGVGGAAGGVEGAAKVAESVAEAPLDLGSDVAGAVGTGTRRANPFSRRKR